MWSEVHVPVGNAVAWWWLGPPSENTSRSACLVASFLRTWSGSRPLASPAASREARPGRAWRTPMPCRWQTPLDHLSSKWSFGTVLWVSTSKRLSGAGLQGYAPSCSLYNGCRQLRTHEKRQDSTYFSNWSSIWRKKPVLLFSCNSGEPQWQKARKMFLRPYTWHRPTRYPVPRLVS